MRNTQNHTRPDGYGQQFAGGGVGADAGSCAVAGVFGSRVPMLPGFAPVGQVVGSDRSERFRDRLLPPSRAGGSSLPAASSPHLGAVGAPLGNVPISARVSAAVDRLGRPDARQWRARARFLPGGVHAAAPYKRARPVREAVVDVDTGEISYPGPARRGVVRGFSTDSRRRLRIALMEVDWRAVDSVWVTLTYHHVWGVEWQEWKRDLRRFRQRLRRRWGDLGGYWRLEYQRRGAPHFHCVVCWERGQRPDVELFRRWVVETWAEVIGESGNRVHLEHGTYCVAVDDIEGDNLGRLLRYMVKEMSKVKQAAEVPGGRMWGRYGDVPTREIGSVELTDEGYCELARRVAELGAGWFADSVSGAWPGLVFLGDGVRLMDALLEDLPGGVVFVPAGGA